MTASSLARARFDFPTGLENLRAALKQTFPGEAAAIDNYLAAVQSAQKACGLYFAEKAVPRPIARLAGRFMRAPFLKWAGQTTLDVLHRWTRNTDLIGILTAQWGDYGLPPSQSSFGVHALIASHYFNGASYPVGGAARIAETITPLIERNGGKVVVSADVAGVDRPPRRSHRSQDGRRPRIPIRHRRERRRRTQYLRAPGIPIHKRPSSIKPICAAFPAPLRTSASTSASSRAPPISA